MNNTYLHDGLLKGYYEKLRRGFYDIDETKIARLFSRSGESGFEAAGRYIDICSNYAIADKSKKILDSAALVVQKLLSCQLADGFFIKQSDESDLASHAPALHGLAGYCALVDDGAAKAAVVKGVDCLDGVRFDLMPPTRLIGCAANLCAALVRVYRIFHYEKSKAVLQRLIDECERSFSVFSFTDADALPANDVHTAIALFIGVCGYARLFENEKAYHAADRFADFAKSQLPVIGEMPDNGKGATRSADAALAELLLMLFYRFKKAEYLDGAENILFNHILARVDDFGGKRLSEQNMPSALSVYGFFCKLKSLLYYADSALVAPMIYAPSEYDNYGLKIFQSTDYPKSGEICFDITTVTSKTLMLRIPRRCDSYTLHFNNQHITKSPNIGFIELYIPKGRHSVKLELKTNSRQRPKRQ